MTQVPLTPIAREYQALVGMKGTVDGRGVMQRRLDKAERFLREPDRLIHSFRKSVDITRRFFASAKHERRTKPFYPDPPRPLLKWKAGVDSTRAVGALFECHQGRLWRVLGDEALSFYYVDRELVVTEAHGLRLAGGGSTRLGPRMDLLLASTDGMPIVCELKVTKPSGAPDKDPFFALIQALACAAYLLPDHQLARLRHHDLRGSGRITRRLSRVDVHLLLVGEPPASAHWFELRDRAERLSSAIHSGISELVRRIAIVDLALLDTPSGGKRLPRFAKRFSVDDAA